MHTKFITSILFSVLLCITFASCVTEPGKPVINTGVFGSHVVYIVNENTFTAPHSSVDCYLPDGKIYYSDIFNSANGRMLGAQTNDVVVGKNGELYIAVAGADSIFAVNRYDGTLTKAYAVPAGTSAYKLAMVNDSQMAVAGYNVNSVLLVNVRTGAIDETFPVGSNPQAISLAGDILCVCCPGFTAKLETYFINLTTKSVSHADLHANPVATITISPSLVAILCGGQYGVPNTAALDFVNPQTMIVTASVHLPGNPFKMARDGQTFYVPCDPNVIRISATTYTVIDTFLTNRNTYGIAFDSVTRNLYLADAKDFTQNGALTVWNQSRQRVDSVATGVNPGTLFVAY